MVIYYSPDAGVMSNSKYCSETELQKFNPSSASSIAYRSAEKKHDFERAYESRGDKLLAKRPMPFLKALEMSNKMEKSSLFNEQAGGKSATTTLTTKTDTTDNRQSQYEMNYEISV